MAVEGEVVPNNEVPQVEVKAREMGWKPKEEFEGDTAKWVEADEFVRNAPFFETIHKQNRTIKKLEKMVSTMAQHTEEVKKASYDQAIKDLKAQKKVAASENDVARVVEIEEKIEAVQSQAKVASSPKDDAVEVFETWKEKNDWFDSDEDMTNYANGVGSRIEREHPDWTPVAVLAEVEKKTKKAFESKFKNPNREAAGKVASSSSTEKSSGKKSKLPTYNDLPKEAQEMYRVLVKTKSNPYGGLTSEQYLRDYALKAGLIQEDE